MKHYKAIVIDGKKLCKYFLGGFSAVLFVVLLLSAALSGKFSAFSPETNIRNVFPSASAANNGYAKTLQSLESSLKRAVGFFLGFNPELPYEIVNAEIPLVKQVQATGIAKIAAPIPTATATPAPAPSKQPAVIPEENQAPIKAIDLSPDKNNTGTIIIGNETAYSVDIQEMLGGKPAIDMTVSGPKVLVIHTHATEAYSPEGSWVYDITAGDRSQDVNENVVRVGKTLCNILNSKGIAAIHDTALHDYPSFNGSYAHSLSAIESYLKQYPSIQVVFDIHRDSIVYSDNTKAKPLTQINGKDAAQLMFVVGTNEKGLEHPHWRENLKTAIHFQNAINQKYPSLMRHINLRQERFNGHTTHGSLIIETGASGNTLKEAEYGLSLAAECIADYLNSLR